MAKLPPQHPTFKTTIEITLVGKDLSHIMGAKNRLRGCLKEALQGSDSTAVFIKESFEQDALNDGIERVPDVSQLQV